MNQLRAGKVASGKEAIRSRRKATAAVDEPANRAIGSPSLGRGARRQARVVRVDSPEQLTTTAARG